MKPGNTFLILLVFTMAFTQQQKEMVIFFGDSITQAGVNPSGYISQIKEIAAREKAPFQFVGAGVGGNKVYDLYLRMEEDVLAKKPAIVVVFIGVNDVWHRISHGTGTDADKFEKFYRAILDKLHTQDIKTILVTPAAIGEKVSGNELDPDLDKFSDIIRKLATEYNLPLVDLRKTFVAYNKMHNASDALYGILTTDGVHLNDKGNQVVAEQIWQALKPMAK